MINPTELAICDIMRHPRRGLVSHQPRYSDKSDSIIVYVRDVEGDLFLVSLDECSWATKEEHDNYWRDFEIKFKERQK